MNAKSSSLEVIARVHVSVRTQFEHVRRELDDAKQSGVERDKAVHHLRKAMQRLRASFRLLQAVDAKAFRKLERQLRRLRRRFGPLRDAAVRLETMRGLLAQADTDTSSSMSAAADQLQAHLDGIWRQTPDAFWREAGEAVDGIEKAFAKHRLDRLTGKSVLAAMERQRRRARRSIRQALGFARHKLRHAMRCRVRRYAVMRELANEWLDRHDAIAGSLVELGKQLGHEGDVWLSLDALGQLGKTAVTGGLKTCLRQQREQLLSQHDGELAVWLRSTFARREQRHGREAGTVSHR